jgi:hypothetical protein
MIGSELSERDFSMTFSRNFKILSSAESYIEAVTFTSLQVGGRIPDLVIREEIDPLDFRPYFRVTHPSEEVSAPSTCKPYRLDSRNKIAVVN